MFSVNNNSLLLKSPPQPDTGDQNHYNAGYQGDDGGIHSQDQTGIGDDLIEQINPDSDQGGEYQFVAEAGTDGSEHKRDR